MFKFHWSKAYLQSTGSYTLGVSYEYKHAEVKHELAATDPIFALIPRVQKTTSIGANSSREGSEEQMSLSSLENYISTNTTSKRACRVIIENQYDFHHEILESVVLRYPLPWHKFNCSTSKPIIFDFALFQNTFHLRLSKTLTAISKTARYLNETEFWGWKIYFEQALQHKVFDRNDGSNIQTKAYFNNLVSYEELNDSPIDAVIDATCDENGRWVQKMKTNDRFFCVLHGSNSDVVAKWPAVLERSCFLSPMWPKDQCTFLAADLPKFDKQEIQNQQLSMSAEEVRICVLGALRNHTMAAEMFSKIPFQDYNAKFYIFARQNTRSLKYIFDETGISAFTSIVREADFVNYHKMIALCDIILPLTEPSEKSSHFPWGGKKSSGIIPTLIAYNISSVMHEEYASIYEHQFTAPFEAYNNTMESKVNALKQMLLKIQGIKTAAKIS